MRRKENLFHLIMKAKYTKSMKSEQKMFDSVESAHQNRSELLLWLFKLPQAKTHTLTQKQTNNFKKEKNFTLCFLITRRLMYVN